MQSRNTAASANPYTIDNPEEFARNMLRLFEEIERAMFGMLARSDAKISPYSGASEVSEAAKTVSDIFLRMWMTDPTMLAVAQGRLARSYMDLWNNSVRRFMGDSIDPVVQPEPSDNRFQGSGVVVESLFRFLDASLSSHDALGGGSAAPD